MGPYLNKQTSWNHYEKEYFTWENVPFTEKEKTEKGISHFTLDNLADTTSFKSLKWTPTAIKTKQKIVLHLIKCKENSGVSLLQYSC